MGTDVAAEHEKALSLDPLRADPNVKSEDVPESLGGRQILHPVPYRLENMSVCLFVCVCVRARVSVCEHEYFYTLCCE
jgi:hypothetical protein